MSRPGNTRVTKLGSSKNYVCTARTIPKAIRAKDMSRQSDWFSPGECRNLIYNVLRDAETPVLTRAIADRVKLANGIDQSDARVVE